MSGPETRPSGQSASGVRYELYTHCGIDEARLGGVFYEAVNPLDDGNGNPPAGWDNPFQVGVMTVTSPRSAEFADGSGHRVLFRVREGAVSYKRLCS